MSSPDGWDNPLAHLQPISQHPSQGVNEKIAEYANKIDSNAKFDYDSELSSPTQGPHHYANLYNIASLTLGNYTKLDDNDDTKEVLGAFLEYLSTAGRTALMEEIEEFSTNPPKLRQLRNFLVEAVLKPSML